MAKKAASSAPKGAPQPAAKPTAKPAPKKAPAAASIDDTAIGNAAGEVWGLLADGPQSLAAVKKVGGSADLAAMALGWLAREGKVTFETSGRGVRVLLRD